MIRLDVCDIRVNWNPVKNPPVPLASGVAAPGAFTAELDVRGGTTVTMDLEVVDRRIVCSTLALKAGKGETLRIPVQRWVETVAASVVMTVKRDGTLATLAPPVTDAEKEEVADVVSGAASRRNVTRDVLERAAQAYREGGGQIGTVQAVLHVSEAQAYRYIRKAREAGVLEPRGR